MKKRIVNLLTLLRIICSVLLGYLVLFFPDHTKGQFLILLIIFASDIMDGRLARKWHVTSRGGAVFDVTADMFFVTVSFAALIFRGIIPLWILCVAAGKFIEFGVTSSILTGTADNRFPQLTLVFDTFGKLSAILLMSFPLPALIINKYIPSDAGDILLIGYMCLITLMAGVSSVYRMRKLRNHSVLTSRPGRKVSSSRTRSKDLPKRRSGALQSRGSVF